MTGVQQFLNILGYLGVIFLLFENLVQQLFLVVASYGFAVIALILSIFIPYLPETLQLGHHFTQIADQLVHFLGP